MNSAVLTYMYDYLPQRRKQQNVFNVTPYGPQHCNIGHACEFDSIPVHVYWDDDPVKWHSFAVTKASTVHVTMLSVGMHSLRFSQGVLSLKFLT